MVVSVMSVTAQGKIDHVVQRGETFQSIAMRYGITEQMLRNTNLHVETCYTGLTLQIDSADIESARQYRRQIEAEQRKRELQARYQQAWKLMDAGKYNDAQKVLDGIIVEAPTALAYYNRGVCYFNREKWNDAASDFRNTINSDDCSDELKDKGRELRDVALKNQEIKSQQRAAMWAGLFSVGLNVATAAMNAHKAKSYSVPTTTNNDYLLNPYYAAAQGAAKQQYYDNLNNQLMTTSIMQVQTELQSEYEQMRQMNPSLSYEQFLQIRATDYGYGTDIGHSDGGGSFDATGSSSVIGETSTPRVREKKHCNLCDGTGWIVETKGVASFGLDKYCSECGKTVPANHYHTKCPSCKGEGQW